MSASSANSSSPTLAEAQREMRFAYYDGAPGLLTSATVWAIAGVVSLVTPPTRAIWTLLLGGMLIFPVSVLLTKALGRPGKHRADNPLGSLALATTFWMILMLSLAFGVSRLRPEWFFPAMLLIIGGRYLTFATLYGLRLYWICGAVLAATGCAIGLANAAPTLGAFAGAAIESGFAAVLFVSARRTATA